MGERTFRAWAKTHASMGCGIFSGEMYAAITLHKSRKLATKRPFSANHQGPWRNNHDLSARCAPLGPRRGLLPVHSGIGAVQQLLHRLLGCVLREPDGCVHKQLLRAGGCFDRVAAAYPFAEPLNLRLRLRQPAIEQDNELVSAPAA